MTSDADRGSQDGHEITDPGETVDLLPMLTTIASATERTSAAGHLVCTILTEDGRTITKMALVLRPSGEIKTVVIFECMDCGYEYRGDATDSETGVHGLTCPACGFVHAEY